MRIAIVLLLAVLAMSGRAEVSSRWAEPLLVDLAGDGIALTDVNGGVDIDLNGDGVAERVAWTVTSSDDAFLCIDNNQNGLVDLPSDLVGGGTVGPPIGFALLAAMDGIRSGRPERISDRRPDGRIDKSDALYERLILWTDTNHNGIPEEEELQGLEHAGVRALGSGYEGVSTKDAAGNRFKYRGWARVTSPRGVEVLREAVTVSLARR